MLIKIMAMIKEIIIKNKLYDDEMLFNVLYLDFKKAFSRVSHGKLVYKSNDFNSVGKLNSCLDSFSK